jgi:tRNA(fMet)-specific endonuclease VapC
VIYVLDTNIAIAVLNRHPAVVSSILERHLHNDVLVCVPSIVMFELWFGVAKSTHRTENAERLRVFARGKLDILPFDSEDARVAGEIRALFRARGTPIGPYDLLIAAQALRRRATLVTSNVTEFRRVEELVLEDWNSPAT